MRKTLGLFDATPSELALAERILHQADPRNTGVLNGDAASGFLSGSDLPESTLGRIWCLADYDDKGWLTTTGIAIAVRLIGWAQIGEEIEESLITRGKAGSRFSIFAFN